MKIESVARTMIGIFIGMGDSCTCSKMPGRLDSPKKVRITRITSYNVCYTKLLRSFVYMSDAYLFAAPRETRNALSSSYMTVDTRPVITSYSIHYTKLYDSTPRRVGSVREQSTSPSAGRPNISRNWRNG